jgi:hypothetical protein
LPKKGEEGFKSNQKPTSQPIVNGSKKKSSAPKWLGLLNYLKKSHVQLPALLLDLQSQVMTIDSKAME